MFAVVIISRGKKVVDKPPDKRIVLLIAVFMSYKTSDITMDDAV